ncbi:MAG: hypothetical protein K2I16_03470 [Muribaculaceae bacterium]|nr:hypothetical protein [Muribaculaceae bacterium]MDE5712673.1 hypothetical protein [Muribaculaceae bacterium]
MESKIRYLVRKLTIVYGGGKESIFPLVIVSAKRNGLELSDLGMASFESETAGTEYVNELCIRHISGTTYEVEYMSR